MPKDAGSDKKLKGEKLKVKGTLHLTLFTFHKREGKLKSANRVAEGIICHIYLAKKFSKMGIVFIR